MLVKQWVWKSYVFWQVMVTSSCISSSTLCWKISSSWSKELVKTNFVIILKAAAMHDSHNLNVNTIKILATNIIFKRVLKLRVSAPLIGSKPFTITLTSSLEILTRNDRLLEILTRDLTWHPHSSRPDSKSWKHRKLLRAVISCKQTIENVFPVFP